MSEVITYFDNITDRAIALLLEQFKTKESFLKFVEVLTNESQELEYIFEEVNELTWLYGSSGIQLDRLGEIVGYPRESRNDDEYRDFLQFGILLNKSAGEPEILITALKLLTNATIVVFYELFPAACFAHTNGQTIPLNITQKMDDLAMGGVKFMYVSQTDGVPFIFASESTEDDGLGYGWIDGASQPVDEGGEYAWALEN